MITWSHFILFALAAMICWIIGSWAAWKEKRLVAVASTLVGILIFLAYIVLMWISLERPPLRTMGETRLWYSFFLPVAGIVIYCRWKYKWILSFGTLMALVFICINIFRPEIHSKTLMPALQSPWFAPHVIVYMFAYSLFGLAALSAAVMLVNDQREKNGRPAFRLMDVSTSLTDNLVYVGYALLTVGMLLGAVWAKDAWGHYWAWDPKETWAAVTWFAYLGYIHLRRLPGIDRRVTMWMLIVAFCLLQMCWWGINYLPSAQATSIHTYSMQ